MATWVKMTVGDIGDQREVWYDRETGNISEFDPTAAPSGQVAEHTSFGGDSGSTDTSYVDPTTGRALSDQTAAGAQYVQQLDAEFQSVWNNPSASSWDKAQAVEKR